LYRIKRRDDELFLVVARDEEGDVESVAYIAGHDIVSTVKASGCRTQCESISHHGLPDFDRRRENYRDIPMQTIRDRRHSALGH